MAQRKRTVASRVAALMFTLSAACLTAFGLALYLFSDASGHSGVGGGLAGLGAAFAVVLMAIGGLALFLGVLWLAKPSADEDEPKAAPLPEARVSKQSRD